MGRRLKDNITSQYISAANRLNSKSARRKVVAYVESYDDVFFWRSILSQFETDRLYFEVMLPSRLDHLNRGKKAVLMSLLAGKTGEDLIACVDADYDYLIQGASETSEEVCHNPYVFHTYAYAIENLQCYAPSLHDVCVAVTLNDKQVFNFEDFFARFSEVIYPLFVWNIWFYRKQKYGAFTLTDFLKVIEVGNVQWNRTEQALGRLRNKVQTKLRQLQRDYPEAKEDWQEMKSSLASLGVTTDNVYLYIQGHHLFDKVVVPLLFKVCDRLVRDREQEISRQSVHATQRRNELSCYQNSVTDLTTMLKKNIGFMRSPQYQQIKKDLEKLFNA
ncbi:MAG: DUF4435 domain-containing protein [Prevotella sp.]|jgi:hypothetical protein